MLKKVKNILTDTLYIKLFFVIIPFLGEIPLLIAYVRPFMKAGLVLAALWLVYDLFTKRSIFKIRYRVFIFAMLISFAITVLLNRQTSFKMNLIEFFYTCATLLVLFPSLHTGDERRTLRELSFVCWSMTLLTVVASSISVILYLFQYKGAVAYNESIYPVGIDINNRLAGLYFNANLPSAALGLFSAITLLAMRFKQRHDGKKWISLLAVCTLWYGVIVNLFCVALQESRGIFIALCAAMFLGAFFLVIRLRFPEKLAQKRLRPLWNLLRGVIVSGACLCVVIVIIFGTQWTAQRIPSWIDNFTHEINHNPQSSTSVDPVPGRNELPAGYTYLTNREDIWKQGFEKLKQRPVFGHGPYSFSSSLKVSPTGNERINHFHNVLIHGAVSLGLTGFVFLLGLLGCGISRLLRHLWTGRSKKHYPLFVCLVASLFFLLVLNMAETTILFQTRQSGYFFWILAGIGISLTAAPETNAESGDN